MRRILVFRFSAMGDVALVAPALLGVVQAYPDVIITVVTRPKFAVFFENMPRIEVVKADIDTIYKGAVGLYKLYQLLNKNNAKYDAIIDLHDNLRTKTLRFYFKIGGFFSINKGNRVFVFNKGRAEKKKLIKHEIDTILPHTTLRYAEAFAQAGFPFVLPQTPIFQFLTKNKEKNKVFNVGIAPFAKHATKELPFSTISELILLLIEFD